MMIFRTIVASAAILAHNELAAEELCGRSFNSFDELYAAVFLERTNTIKQPQLITIVDRNRTVWRFTQAIHPAAPAVACVGSNANGERQQQLWCRASQGCEMLVQGISGTFERK